MGRPAIQVEIPGTEDPNRDPDLEVVLFAWQDAKDEQRRVADTAKIRHASLLAAMAERKLDRYPYLDRLTGKKHYVVADKTPKAKTIKAPTVKKQKASDERKAESAAEKRQREREESVEHRRVPRASVEGEIYKPTATVAKADDPFAATRAAMGDLET